MTISTCIGCGCDDNHACAGGCSWLRLDAHTETGVCSGCTEMLPAWEAGQRFEKYRPSNGTEGDGFISKWCGKCARDKSLSEDVDFDECEEGECCDIVTMTFMYGVNDPKYPKEWICGKNGPCCMAFVPKGEAIPQKRCVHTVDMFEVSHD
jgi:hypothetical protein